MPAMRSASWLQGQIEGAHLADAVGRPHEGLQDAQEPQNGAVHPTGSSLTSEPMTEVDDVTRLWDVRWLLLGDSEGRASAADAIVELCILCCHGCSPCCPISACLPA